MHTCRKQRPLTDKLPNARVVHMMWNIDQTEMMDTDVSLSNDEGKMDMDIMYKRVIRMTWDIDPVTTKEMMMETGVSVLNNDGKMDMDINYKPAPLMSQTMVVSHVFFSTSCIFFNSLNIVQKLKNVYLSNKYFMYCMFIYLSV